MAVPSLQDLAMHSLVNHPKELRYRFIPSHLLNRLLVLARSDDKLDDDLLMFFPRWVRVPSAYTKGEELYRITSLNLRYCTRITDAGLNFAVTHPLVELDISGCRVLDSAFVVPPKYVFVVVVV